MPTKTEASPPTRTFHHQNSQTRDLPLRNQHAPTTRQPQQEQQQHQERRPWDEYHDELPLHPQHTHLPTPTAALESVDAWNALALQHVQNGEYDMALAAFQHVLRAYKLQFGNVHPLVASAYHNLGTVHAKRAQLLLDDTLHQRHCRAQSLQCFQSAARAARDSLGRDHPNVAVSLVRIGFLLLQARQYNNAVITFQEALRIRQVHYGPHHALVANLYNNLGVCYMHLGQFAHGRDLLHHALTIQRTLLAAAQLEQDGSTQEEKKDSAATPPQTANQSLELADTLFNIGGLALEWIRRQGPDVRHAQDAEEAFEESMEVR
jgi:tetratricopeptide (TPR) repeat protein